MYLIHFLGINFSNLFSFMLKESFLVRNKITILYYVMVLWMENFPSRSSLQNPTRVLKLSNNYKP